MRFIITLFVSIALVSCTPDIPGKEFNGNLTLSPAESAPLCFDRLIELKNTSEERQLLKEQYKELGFPEKFTGLAIKFDPQNVTAVEQFIDDNEQDLILSRGNSFVWKKTKNYAMLFLKNDKKSVNISPLVLKTEQKDSILTITFDAKAKKILSSYSMKYLNRPILMQINNELITTVKSFGKLENNELNISLSK